MERVELNRRTLESCGYAVIDPAAVDRGLWEHLPVQSLAPATYSRLASQFPCVLPLNALSQGERDSLFADVENREAAAESPIFCLLIESTQTPGAVIRHLSRMMFARSPVDQKPYQLRFYDAYTLMQLSWILDPSQQRTLLGPSTAWICPLEQWWCLRPSKSTMTPPGLRLSAGQWQQLQRVGTINRALARQGAAPDQLSVLGMQIDPWLAMAGSVGLTDEEDVIAFAMQGMTCHPEFHRHPRITRILDECEGQPKRYGRLTAGLREADWQRIAADMSLLSA